MTRHDQYLEELVRNLHRVDERTEDVAWIMKEGIYMPRRSTNYNKLCDLILGYYDQSITLIELKGSRKKRLKAKQQLASGANLARLMGYEDITAKIVYYSKQGFEYDLITRF